MKYSISIAAVLAATASAGPTVSARQASAITDVQILNYALTLEHLENAFYAQGLKNYTQAQFVAAGFADPFYKNLQEIAFDEATHVSFLSTALGSAATKPCTYRFPVTDPKSFVAVSGILEGVGVSAYLGAAKDILVKDYLTAAGSILTVEARHSAYIRAAQAQLPFPQPFDTPLDYNEVYTLAAPFIVECPPTNPALPVKAYPTIAVTTTGTISSGSTVSFSTPGLALVVPAGTAIYAAFLSVTGPTFVPVTSLGNGAYSIVIPAGFFGQTYFVLTNCNTYVDPSVILAGPGFLEVTK